MANLHAVLLELIAKAQTGGSRGGPAAGALYQKGTVAAVNADGTYTVRTASGTMVANPETDLPLEAGQAVFVSPVRNGKPVVHGPRYG